MKIIINFIIVFLLCSLGISAQEFQVESFRLVSEDASATHEVLKDNNDNPCAILRIKSSESGLKIAGNVVGKMMTNGKEYILNVASGTKKITVVKKGMLPLTVNFNEYNIRALKSKAGYDLTLRTVVRSTEVSGEVGGHEYVDLGLSVKWATYNIGASKIADPGKKYKYGETVEYDENRPYTFDGIGELNEIIKTIPPSRDVAHTKWGNSWRMPTQMEWAELNNNCERVWITKNGIPGILYIAKNGNKIFFPAQQYDKFLIKMNYWLSDGFVSDSKFQYSAIIFDTAALEMEAEVHGSSGFYVRAVSNLPKIKETKYYDYALKPDGFQAGHAYVDLGLSVKWATMNVGAKNVHDVGNFYYWGAIKPDEEFVGYTEMGYLKGYPYYETKNDMIYGPKGIAQFRTKDDVACSWGSGWFTPTLPEIYELIEKCTWTWTYSYRQTGMSGYVVRSNVPGFTDKLIFLPVVRRINDFRSYSGYWSNTRAIRTTDDKQQKTDLAYCLCLDNDYYHFFVNPRFLLNAIRPVCR